MTITAAVDGSSLGNPGPAGWAWVVSDDVWAAGGFERATNNIGELTALLKLLEHTREAGFAEEHLKVYADSQYVINAVTKWMAGWKRRGWKKADGKPVANRDLMIALDRELEGREVTFEWVRGHAGHDLNEAADMRAFAAAQAYQTGAIVHEGPRFENAFASKTGLAKAAAGRVARGRGSKTEGQAKTPQTSTARAGSAQSKAAQEPSPKDEKPLVAISAEAATKHWERVLSSAAIEPVTITQKDKPSLLLLDADTAWKALALLDSLGPTDEGHLF